MRDLRSSGEIDTTGNRTEDGCANLILRLTVKRVLPETQRRCNLGIVQLLIGEKCTEDHLPDVASDGGSRYDGACNRQHPG
jgi:hypothetical protein